MQSAFHLAPLYSSAAVRFNFQIVKRFWRPLNYIQGSPYYAWKFPRQFIWLVQFIRTCGLRQVGVHLHVRYGRQWLQYASPGCEKGIPVHIISVGGACVG